LERKGVFPLDTVNIINFVRLTPLKLNESGPKTKCV